MGSRLGRRVVHFANLPIKLLMPKTFTNIKEIAIKTIPSASKIEIKRILETLYGFEVENVQTLNMEGKKKKRGGLLFAKPDYKKAYVTLREPLSLSSDLFPVKIIQEEIRRKQKGSSFVDEEDEKNKHWLDGKERDRGGFESRRGYRRGGFEVRRAKPGGGNESRGVQPSSDKPAAVKFPWSSLRNGK